CTRTGKQVEHADARKVVRNDAHPCLTNPVRRGSHPAIARAPKAAAAPSAGDDAHLALPSDVSETCLQAALSTIFVALQPEGDVDRLSHRQLPRECAHAPAERVELAVAVRQAQTQSVLADRAR